MKHRENERSRGWRTPDDIEWPFVIQQIHKKFVELFRLCARREPDSSGKVNVTAHVHVEDFVEITLYERTAEGQIVRLTDLDPKWSEDFEELSSSFAAMLSCLSDDDQMNAAEEISSMLESLLKDECCALAKENFFFPADAEVAWTVETSS